ncbi:MAG: glycoside hydrolase family 3 N-terminal domain-containing protein [Nocardioides sp.]
MRVRGRSAAAALATLLALAGCTAAPEPAPAGVIARVAQQQEKPPPVPPARRLGLVTGWGPTADELDRAARLVGRLALPDLAGQVIVAEWVGTRAPTRLVRSLHLGGVIAFGANVASTGQIRAVNRTLSRAVPRDWPLFLAVDQEGGLVQRVQGDATRFPAFMSAGAARRPALTRAAARAGGAELRGLGFTVDFAPDADVTTGPEDPTIGSRSAGSDPGVVAEHATAAARGLLASGVVPVLKHFPGHGSVPADSHLSLPVQTRTLHRLRAADLVPFRVGIDAGLPAVMVGHLDVRNVDPRVPSSLSRRLVMGLLRSELGFQGLVVTDSLSMTGVRATHDGAESAVQALLAGVDVVLMPPDPAYARAGIIRAVRTGGLSRGRLEQAAARQVALLLHQQGTTGRPPGSGVAASRALSGAAVTVVAGPCRGRLVGRTVRPVGDPVAVARFVAAARAAGLPVRRRGTRVAFAGYGEGAVRADVAVAVDSPYVLGPSRARVKIATYGDTPGAMAALVEVLTGAARAPGRLPVAVAGRAPRTC